MVKTVQKKKTTGKQGSSRSRQNTPQNISECEPLINNLVDLKGKNEKFNELLSKALLLLDNSKIPKQTVNKEWQGAQLLQLLFLSAVKGKQ